MMGLSTSGSISLGWALVAGRKRVPRPAAGNTALPTFMGMGRSLFVRRRRLLLAQIGAGIIVTGRTCGWRFLTFTAAFFHSRLNRLQMPLRGSPVALELCAGREG